MPKRNPRGQDAKTSTEANGIKEIAGRFFEELEKDDDAEDPSWEPAILAVDDPQALSDAFKDAAHAWAEESQDCPVVAAIQLVTAGMQMLYSFAPEQAGDFIRAYCSSAESILSVTKGGTEEMSDRLHASMLVDIEERAQRLHDALHDGIDGKAAENAKARQDRGEKIARKMAASLQLRFPGLTVELVRGDRDDA